MNSTDRESHLHTGYEKKAVHGSSRFGRPNETSDFPKNTSPLLSPVSIPPSSPQTSHPLSERCLELRQNLLGNPITTVADTSVPTTRPAARINSPENTTSKAGGRRKGIVLKIEAPKALEKLEMMVADIEDQAKKTEEEAARRVEELQVSPTLDESLLDPFNVVVSRNNEEAINLSDCQAESVKDAGFQQHLPKGRLNEISINMIDGNHPEVEKENLNVSSHSLPPVKHPESRKSELPPVVHHEAAVDKTRCISENEFGNGSEKSVPSNNSSVGCEFLQDASKEIPQEQMDEQQLRKQELLEIPSRQYVLKRKEYEEQQKIKRQQQIEQREKKLSEKKRLQSVHSDEKHVKKDSTRLKSAKSKKVKITDGAIVQSLKELPPLQLCEPEFLMSSLIIQPSLNGFSNGQTIFKGSFGRSYIVGIEDHYGNKVFPDNKVCLGNPPTPPTSLPPSPPMNPLSGHLKTAGTKEHPIYDILSDARQDTTSSLYPTPPHGDSLVGMDLKGGRLKKKISNKQMIVNCLDPMPSSSSQLNQQQDQSNLLPAVQHASQYPAFVIDKGLTVRSKRDHVQTCNDSDVNGIYGDVNVTLTIAAISDKTIHETVNAISKLIDVDTPPKLAIQPPVRDVSTVGADTSEHSGKIQNKQSLSESDKDEKMISTQGSSECSDMKNNVRKDADGPYCRHCDVLILGIGVVRKESSDTNKDVNNEASDLDYSNVNVEDGTTCNGNIFCSSACLKQYYSLDLSQTSSDTKGAAAAKLSIVEEELKTKGSATTNELLEDAGDVEVRGCDVAEGMSSSSLPKPRQHSFNEEDQVSTITVIILIVVLLVMSRMLLCS